MIVNTHTPQHRQRSRDGSLDKSLRLVLLLELDRTGKLDGLSVRTIAERYFPDAHFTTIARDKRELPRLREKLKALQE